MRAQPKASHYINGRFVDDEQGAPLPVIYPATGETIATLHSATPNIVELAIEAARAALDAAVRVLGLGPARGASCAEALAGWVPAWRALYNSRPQ